MGFEDHGGACVVHIMGGLAGFIGTYLIGPRVGLFKQDTTLAYVLDDNLIDEDETMESDFDARRYKTQDGVKHNKTTKQY